ncbi:site-specific integrase [Sulfuricurvum sp.]|uniref:site-specific integrase n=1 Tax=Sulfuricurvum sp. TaxID=2025608 RepID=UPI0025E67111|nr:site-specific integrase [Sulfuricurvum sp.]
MANIRIRYGNIHIDYMVDGERKRKSTGLPNTKANRELVERSVIPKLVGMIATGEIHRNKPKNFGYYFNEFLKTKNINRSFNSKLPHWKKLNETFKDINIDKITRFNIKRYLLDMPIKNNSKGVYKSALQEIFEIAIDDEVIVNNPAVNIRLKSDHKQKIDFFTKEEVNILLENAEDVMLAYLMIAFNTGLRPEEILGLQWGDISDTHINIKRVRTRGRIDHPKTRNSIRSVPYPAFIMDSIKSIYSGSIFIFGDIDDSTGLRCPWRSLLKKTGLGKRKLYNTRHTFATIMLQDRIVSINELAGLLGHSTPKITLSHYASVIEAKTIDLGINFDLFGTFSSRQKNQGLSNIVK